MMMPEHTPAFSLPDKTMTLLVLGVFALGTFALLLLIIAAFIVVVLALNDACTVASRLMMQVSDIYSSGDALIKLIILGVPLYIVAKAGQRIYRSFKR